MGSQLPGQRQPDPVPPAGLTKGATRRRTGRARPSRRRAAGTARLAGEREDLAARGKLTGPWLDE